MFGLEIVGSQKSKMGSDSLLYLADYSFFYFLSYSNTTYLIHDEQVQHDKIHHMVNQTIS